MKEPEQIEYIRPAFEKPNSKEWEFVSEADNGKFQIFMNTKSISKQPNKIRVEDMYNYIDEQKRKDGIIYQSFKSLNSVDCKERKLAAISIVYYEKKNGQGSVVYSANIDHKDAEYSFVVPDSVGESFLKTACRKAPK